jgi:hypothetical protein
LTPVDAYQAYQSAEETVGLKLGKDLLVIIQKSGGVVSWPYFDNFDQVVKYAREHLPRIGGKSIECQVHSENC